MREIHKINLRSLNINLTRHIGIRRYLIGVDSITKVKQRRVPVHNWIGDRLVPPEAVYTGQCAQRCRVVGHRAPRKSNGSSE